jgi:hypothetical protein
MIGVFDVATTPAGVRDDLVACCEDAAEWRLEQAAWSMQTECNPAGVRALETAAQSFAALPDDDLRLERLAWVWDRLGDDQRVVAFTEERRVIREHGVRGTATADELLGRLAKVAEAVLRAQLAAV